jgi:hypothetical protein
LPIGARAVLAFGLWLGHSALTLAAAAPETWPQRQRDPQNTGRADFSVSANRLNTNFFNAIRWQKPAPGSPNDGNFGASAMVFADGAGPAGADLVVGGYHWPKGVQGMDRHTGALFWTGNPDGGESIGDNTAAFSTNGATIYVINDATAHPLMAFAATNGPGTYWFADTDPGRNNLSAFSPKVTADGRIFAHAWNDRPYGSTDNGTAISLSWSAASPLCSCYNCPALWADTNRLLVVSGGRCGMIKAWDGVSGAELWSLAVPSQTDADATIDPGTGNIYLPIGADSIWIAGVDKNGHALWSQPTMTVFQWQNGVNNPQRAQSTGCLAQDSQTYYFQTVSQQGDGRLYAIRTTDGSVKWSLNTGSKSWENPCSSPIVTSNGVLVVGNNDGGAYFAVRDAVTSAVMVASLTMATNSVQGANGAARSSATLSPEGLLYLPVRITWTQSNGDGDSPTQLPANVFTAFDLNATPNITVPAPSAQRGRPLNAAVALLWTPISPSFGAVFDHYAVYRATNSFTSLAGLVPVATVSNLNATGVVDARAINGVAYFYYVSSVSTSSTQVQTVQSVGPYRPYDETDLQVLSLSRTPRFPRYAAQYTGYETNEPSGFGPYDFGAATGLGNGQTASTPRWPTNGQPVTYTATVRNRGSNPWPGDVHARWSWDGQVIGSPTVIGPLPPDGLTTFVLTRPWDGQRHTVQFTLTDADARTNNNSRSLDTKSVAYLSYVDQTYYENFRATSYGDPNAVTDDMFDWVNRHTDRMNQMFADVNCPKRVHLDVLEMLADDAPDPGIDTIYFAVFPFRYRAGDGSLRQYSGYYYPTDDIDYGLLHEMGHQLGLIDLYQMDVPADLNLVSHQAYYTVPDLMHGVSHFFSPHSALAMTHWEDQAHGYYGQFLYGLPAQISLRFIGIDGQPLVGAAVKMYQYCSRPGLGQVISTQIKAQGITDTNGVWTLPNVPLDHSLAPALPTGDTLKDNPFGYVNVIGNNGVLHFRLDHNGFTDYAWFDITEPNVAYYQGQTNSATFTRNVALGGLVQYFPPAELSEASAGAWAAWAQDSAPGNTWTTNDTQRRLVGTNSLKFVTDGGFDTYVRYPGTFLAMWDLTTVQTLHASFYAENPNGSFQNGSPWIRLNDPDGNYFQYQYYRDGGPGDILNDAIGQWQSYIIPLNASDTETNGWRRTASGTPDMSHIVSLEVHMDTWGNGFTVWLDGVSFQPTPGPLRLTVTLQSNGLLLSWPALPSNYSLQSGPEAVGPYGPQSGTVTETNGTRSMLFPISAQRRFFRLLQN